MTKTISASDIPDDCRKYVIRFLPVMPPHLDKGAFGQQNLLRQYEMLLSLSANQFEIYGSILGVSSKKVYGYSIARDISGKHGIFEQEIVGKRLSMCGRSVITPDPRLDIDEVIIPSRMMTKLGVKNGDMVLLNRQPTLKKYSILALKVLCDPDEESKTVKFNPCLCKSYNADFDGDEMNIFVVPKTESSLRDSEKMLPSRNIISDQDDKPIIYPHQDCHVALGKEIVDEVKKNPTSTLVSQRQSEAYKILYDEEFSLSNFKSSLERIIKSGARGSLENFEQMFKQVGEQNMTRYTKTEGSRHIKHSFEEGLSFDEMFIHCQSSREGIVSVGVNTPSSGYLEKKMIRSMGNMIYDSKRQVHRIKKKIVGFEPL